MPLNPNPPLDLREIHKEIYGSYPTGTTDLNALVQVSNLSDKTLPHDILMFLGYSHSYTLIGDYLYAIWEHRDEPNSLITVPRRAYRRINGNTSSISVDPNSVQTGALDRMRQGVHLLLAKYRVWYIDHNGFIFYTEDKGLSWSHLLRIPGIQGIWFNSILVPHAINPDVSFQWGALYCFDREGQLYHVSPTGTTTKIYTIPEKVNNTNWLNTGCITMLPNGSRLFIGGTNVTNGGVIEYTNGLPTTSTSWTRFTTLRGGMVAGIIFINNTQGMYYGKQGSCGATGDGGNTWSWYNIAPDSDDSVYDILAGGKTGDIIVLAGVNTENNTPIITVHTFTSISGSGSGFYRCTPPSLMGTPMHVRLVDANNWFIACNKDLDGTSSTASDDMEVYFSSDQGVTWRLADVRSNEVVDLIKISDIAEKPSVLVYPSIVTVSDTSTSYTFKMRFTAKVGSTDYVVPSGESITLNGVYTKSTDNLGYLSSHTIPAGSSSVDSSQITINKETYEYTLSVHIQSTSANAAPSDVTALRSIAAKTGANYPYAGEVSANYTNDADACSYGNSTVPVYTTDGTFEIGLAIYYNASGTNMLTNGYYLTDFGEWIRVANDQILEKGLCGTSGGGGGGTPPPGGGGGPIMEQ
jgi:hypothetical protein